MINMALNRLVFIGAENWSHPAWNGSFYPDGLPDDWLLSYYNTRFHAVFLAETFWRGVQESTWRQWLNDTHEGFVFVLESGMTAPPRPASERILRATPAWVGAHVWWLDEQPDLHELAQRVTRHAGTGQPLFVFSRSGNLALMEQADALRQVMGY